MVRQRIPSIILSAMKVTQIPSVELVFLSIYRSAYRMGPTTNSLTRICSASAINFAALARLKGTACAAKELKNKVNRANEASLRVFIAPLRRHFRGFIHGKKTEFPLQVPLGNPPYSPLMSRPLRMGTLSAHYFRFPDNELLRSSSHSR